MGWPKAGKSKFLITVLKIFSRRQEGNYEMRRSQVRLLQGKTNSGDSVPGQNVFRSAYHNIRELILADLHSRGLLALHLALLRFIANILNGSLKGGRVNHSAWMGI